jgi:uncharacterized membrane protein
MTKRRGPEPSHTGRQRRTAAAERAIPVGRDWVVFGVALAGVAIALYLTVTKLSGGTAVFCEAGTGCDVLQASRWSTFLYLPTAAWGAVLYAALAALAFTGLPVTRWLLAFVLAAAATGFSAYMQWIAAFEVRALCPWCLALALVGVASLVAIVLRRPPGAGRRARPARLAGIGVATAVITVFVAAGVFAVNPGAPATGFAADLARHLAATNQIMYGVFW